MPESIESDGSSTVILTGCSQEDTYRDSSHSSSNIYKCQGH